MDDSERGHVIEIWKATVEVQRHFNDISMRIRSIFVTGLLALLASIGFFIDKKLGVEIFGLNIKFYVLMPIFGIGGACLFYFIDRYWYHRLLVGSVVHGAKIEEKYSDQIPDLQLTKSIGESSPSKHTGIIYWIAKVLVRHDKFKETGQLHSDGKIEVLYKSVMVALLLASVFLGATGGVTSKEKEEPVEVPTKTQPANKG